MKDPYEVFNHLRRMGLSKDWRLFSLGDVDYLENTRTRVKKVFEWRKYCCDCCNGSGFKPKEDVLRDEFDSFELE